MAINYSGSLVILRFSDKLKISMNFQIIYIKKEMENRYKNYLNDERFKISRK